MSLTSHIKLIECPRDAMQGMEKFIPTELKIKYLNLLLKVGFHTLDFGSFVSAKAIPQLKDTSEIVSKLDLANSITKLLAIVANYRGAEDACQFDEITFVGFPLSLSETFQQRNTNKSITQAFVELNQIQELILKKNKQLVVYLSMGFGNPYGDPYNSSYIEEFVSKLDKMDVKFISPSDTIGVSNPESIFKLFTPLIQNFPHIEFGAHLHSTPYQSLEKIEAIFKSGCYRLDGAIRGFGGCPMAKDELVGNLATEQIIKYLHENSISTNINNQFMDEALKMSLEVF
jgi:hydroxymethylglutaryl-CoA lyase